ncbi:MAG: sugar phosphate isomerase/epimerase [Draconibacterium sp.]|nr:sugar phosphate isomerase/epimerase [Draconibacterium sp.]
MEKKSTRRKFIQTAALGAAALTTGISKASASEMNPGVSEKMSPLKLGIMTYNLGKDWDIDTIIKNCTETGWVHAELRTTHKHGVEVTLSKQESAEVKKRFKDSPLEAISLASAFQYHFIDQSELRKNIEGTKEYLQLAADVGAIGIRVFPNAFPEGVNREKTMEQIGKSLAEVGEIGRNLGVDVRVCVHGNVTNSVPVIKQIIDYSQSPYVYVNWNCDATDVQGPGLVANFNSVKDRIRGVHLHDMTDEKYPYRLFFKLLSESGYKGYCNAEVDESCEPIKFMKYYRALFLALQNAI